MGKTDLSLSKCQTKGVGGILVTVYSLYISNLNHITILPIETMH
jgi:hypothetical protein